MRSSAAFEPAPFPRWDVHVHVPRAAGSEPYRLLAELGISGGVNLSGGPALDTLRRQIQSAPADWKQAITLPWRRSPEPDFVPRAMDHLSRARGAGAAAFKIGKGLGLAHRDRDGSLLAVDAPRLDPLFERAGELEMPVFIHTADPRAFWLPNTPANPRFEELSVHPDWSNALRPVPSFKALWRAFARRVERHPGTRFVGVHFGNLAEDPTAVSDLLERCPNLWVDLAARIPELGRSDSATVRELFLRWQDRILFGSDFAQVGPGAFMLGTLGETPARRDQVPQYYRSCWRWLETDQRFESMTPLQGRHRLVGLALPRDVLRRIYVGNARRLL